MMHMSMQRWLVLALAALVLVHAASCSEEKKRTASDVIRDTVPKGMHLDPTKVGLNLADLASAEYMASGGPTGQQKGVFFTKPSDNVGAPVLGAHCYQTVTDIRNRVKEARASGGTPQWPSDRLSLAHCSLAKVPDELGELSNLEVLDLTGNLPTTLPDSLGKLSKLRHLRLEGAKLGQMPSVVKHLVSLEVLEIVECGLTSLPAWVSSLRQLIVLNLSGNQLSALPTSLASLSKLEVLTLTNNSLAAFPEVICSLSSLTELHLSDNALRSLPPCVGSLTNVHWMPLARNKLTALPDTMGKLTKLRGLIFNENELTALPASFAALTVLQTIDLSANKLTEFPPALRASAPLIKMLRLWQNRIAAFPDWLDELTALTELDVYSNRIAALPAKLGALTTLEHLVLASNELPSVSESVFSQMTALRELALGENPFTFDGTGLPAGWCTDPASRFYTLVAQTCVDMQQVKDGTYEPCNVIRA